MESLLIFVIVLAAVSARNVPNADYVPTQEQLETIFGADTQIQTKTTAAETPALVPNESVTIEKNIKPYQDKNEIFNSVTPGTVELNIRIKVNDCAKTEADKTAKQNPEKADPVVHTRYVENVSRTDDRVSLGGDDCPSGKVKFNGKCVTPD